MGNVQDKPQVIEGRKTEEKFAKLFRNPIFSDVEQDRHEHWDVEIGGVKFDIKGLKHAVKGEDPDEMYHIVELKNYNGDAGWLYGKADCFAFETHDYWVLVEAKKLREFVAEKTEKVIVKDFDRSILYKLFRWDFKKTKALITMVKTIDLMYLSYEIKKKV